MGGSSLGSAAIVLPGAGHRPPAPTARRLRFASAPCC